MAHPTDELHLDASTVVPPNLARRVCAAGVDVALVGFCCGALFLSFNPVFAAPHPWVWRPGAAVLALLAVTEILTGRTVGKALAGLSLRTQHGGRPPVRSLALRGVVRLAPVGIFLLGLGAADPLAWMYVLQALIVVVGCYLTICYMALWRRGSTMFDAIAGTRAVRTREARPRL